MYENLLVTYLKKKLQENKVPIILWQKLNAHTVYALVTQRVKNAKEIKLDFYGNVRHDTTKPKSQQIKGEGRKNMKNMYKSSFHMNPSDIYRQGLSSIPSEQLSSGNRDGAGQSKKVYENIKHEALHEINSFDNVHKNLLTLQEKLKKNDETECLAKGLAFRKIFDFRQSITFIQTELKVELFNESSARLYHDLSKKEILGIDATGSVVRKINNFEKMFLYAITIRHPFGKTFRLPGALYITSDHTIESVRYFIMCLREKERNLFSKKGHQGMIIVDNSRVLQIAVLSEWNGETIHQYCDRI